MKARGITLAISRTKIDGCREALMFEWMVAVLTENKLLKEKFDLNGRYSWMVGKLITMPPTTTTDAEVVSFASGG